jgi:putative FmdB family regulatory protein
VPLYEYECSNCGRHTEKIEKVTGPHLKKCPHCGGRVERLLSKPAIQFKGSGWYVTDYAGKSEKSDGEKPAPAGTSSDSKEPPAKESASTDRAKETKKAEERKPAKKK